MLRQIGWRCRVARGWRIGRWVMAASVSVAAASVQSAPPPNLSGMWTLQDSTGNLPDQAVRAVDGVVASAPVAIQIDQTNTSLTVRRVGRGAAVLRLMVMADSADDEPRRSGILSARAEWRDGSLVARGDVTVKQGFLKRRVPFEERWQLGEEGRRLTVTMTLKTPVGTKQRIQVFRRAAESALVVRREPALPDTDDSKKISQRSELLFTSPGRESKAARSHQGATGRR